MNLTILYQDKHILALNKPAGLVVHADGKTKNSLKNPPTLRSSSLDIAHRISNTPHDPSPEGLASEDFKANSELTLADWVLEHFPETKDVGEPIVLTSGQVIHRPGIVHRLDRDTSGVILVALTEQGFDYLKRQFHERMITKKYHTFVYGIMKEDDGTIDRPITRSRKDFRLWSAQRGGRGEAREAVTHCKVLQRIEGADATFVEAEPQTGRTHQIRVHFKAINHPVVADPLYAPKREPILGFERLALHAKEITFENLEGKNITVEAPYPADFEVALSKIA